LILSYYWVLHAICCSYFKRRHTTYCAIQIKKENFSFWRRYCERHLFK
jgi:hypothetical protein